MNAAFRRSSRALRHFRPRRGRAPAVQPSAAFLSRRALDPQRAVQLRDALTDADKSETTSLSLSERRRLPIMNPEAVVFDRDQYGIRQSLQVHPARGGARVLGDVRERLLHDTIGTTPRSQGDSRLSMPSWRRSTFNPCRLPNPRRYHSMAAVSPRSSSRTDAGDATDRGRLSAPLR